MSLIPLSFRRAHILSNIIFEQTNEHFLHINGYFWTINSLHFIFQTIIIMGSCWWGRCSMRAFCTVSAPLEACAPPTRPLLPGSRFLALKWVYSIYITKFYLYIFFLIEFSENNFNLQAARHTDTAYRLLFSRSKKPCAGSLYANMSAFYKTGYAGHRAIWAGHSDR